jgi:hypothetical protein
MTIDVFAPRTVVKKMRASQPPGRPPATSRRESIPTTVTSCVSCHANSAKYGPQKMLRNRLAFNKTCGKRVHLDFDVALDNNEKTTSSQFTWM